MNTYPYLTSGAKFKAHGCTNLQLQYHQLLSLSVREKEKNREKLKTHEKYLMVSICEDLSCELRKFTTSQFRSKLYLVPMSECHPVAPTVLAQSLQGPFCGLHKPSPFDSGYSERPHPLCIYVLSFRNSLSVLLF